jgi:hypothetical protein
MPTQSAPAGYEWKHVKLPRERVVRIGGRVDVMFLTADMTEAVLAVCVPQGEKGAAIAPRKPGALI